MFARSTIFWSGVMSCYLQLYDQSALQRSKMRFLTSIVGLFECMYIILVQSVFSTQLRKRRERYTELNYL